MSEKALTTITVWVQRKVKREGSLHYGCSLKEKAVRGESERGGRQAGVKSRESREIRSQNYAAKTVPQLSHRQIYRRRQGLKEGKTW